MSTPNAFPTAITTGPDGAMWFTEVVPGRIGRLALRQTSKDECKDGGDRRFGFSNQGRCIASVNGPQP